MQKGIDRLIGVLEELDTQIVPSPFLYETTLELEQSFTIAEKINGVSPDCFQALRNTFKGIRGVTEALGFISGVVYLLESPEKKKGFRFDCMQFAAGKKIYGVSLFKNMISILALDIPGLCSFLHQHQIVNCELSIYSNVTQSIGNLSIYGNQPFQFLNKITAGATSVSLIIIFLCSALETWLKDNTDTKKKELNDQLKFLKNAASKKEDKGNEFEETEITRTAMIQEKEKEIEEENLLSNQTWYKVSISVATAVIISFKLIKPDSLYIPYFALTKHTISLTGKLKFF